MYTAFWRTFWQFAICTIWTVWQFKFRTPVTNPNCQTVRNRHFPNCPTVQITNTCRKFVTFWIVWPFKKFIFGTFSGTRSPTRALIGTYRCPRSTRGCLNSIWTCHRLRPRRHVGACARMRAFHQEWALRTRVLQSNEYFTGSTGSTSTKREVVYISGTVVPAFVMAWTMTTATTRKYQD